jgi:hypothetical protein
VMMFEVMAFPSPLVGEGAEGGRGGASEAKRAFAFVRRHKVKSRPLSLARCASVSLSHKGEREFSCGVNS